MACRAPASPWWGKARPPSTIRPIRWIPAIGGWGLSTSPPVRPAPEARRPYHRPGVSPEAPARNTTMGLPYPTHTHCLIDNLRSQSDQRGTHMLRRSWWSFWRELRGTAYRMIAWVSRNWSSKLFSVIPSPGVWTGKKKRPGPRKKCPGARLTLMQGALAAAGHDPRSHCAHTSPDR
jgi:hypothetical protein